MTNVGSSHQSRQAHQAHQQLTVRPLSGALGAAVEGVDLSQLTDARFAELHDALMAHQVLYFPEQNISATALRDFAARFGPLQTHPTYPTVDGLPEVTLLDYDESRPSKVDSWHTDMTFKTRPPLGTMLHCQILPRAGGDTLFSSMTAAYEALSDRWQHFLDGMLAVHDFKYGFKETLAEPGAYERLKGAIADNPPVLHPVVRTHPVTQKKGIYVNQVFTTAIEDMSGPESRAVLDFLYEHITIPEFTCRVAWAEKAVAVWDNRATQHRPVNDYWPARRQMRRIVIEGEEPS